MLTPLEAVMVVVENERKFDQLVVNDIFSPLTYWNNPAEHLVNYALQKWNERMLKADNTTCVIVMIDTMGPSKLERLRRRREDRILQLSKQQKLSMDINAYLKYHLLPGANGQNAAASLVGLSATNPLPICASLQRKCHPIVNDSDTRATRPLSLNDTNKVIVNHIRIGCEGKKLDDGKIDTESLAKKSGSLCPVNSSPAGAASGLDSSKDHTSNISIYKVMDIENETDHKTSKSKMRFSICLSGDESADGKITDSDRGNGNDNSMMPASRCVETGEIDHNANIKDEGNESCENKESPSTDVTVERRNIDINNHNVATLPQVRRTLSLQPKMLRTRTRKSLDDQLAPCPSDIAKSVKSKLPTSTSKTSNGKLDLRERITKRFLSPHLADTQNISENPGPYLRSSNNSHNQHSRTSISDDEFSHKLNEKANTSFSKRYTCAFPYVLSLPLDFSTTERGPPGWGRARMTLFSRTSNPFLPSIRRQHLRSLQLAEKCPTIPHVQYLRGLTCTGATPPLTFSRVTQRRFPDPFPSR
ncbi:PPM1D [Acanthosepion pharaonis]|uniref:PPM1D n=1 Tax=Acanthosepion pharaonis TaxID=158019 RepID=A0A812E2M7_ACAPH|nr:PPM1D [Sepia pharaonis]